MCFYFSICNKCQTFCRICFQMYCLSFVKSYLKWFPWLKKPHSLWKNVCTFGMLSFARKLFILTHWGRVTHIYISNLTIIGSDNGLSPGWHQAIIWTSAEILLNGPLGTNFNEILIEIYTFSFKKIYLKMSPGKWQPFCLGLNELTHWLLGDLNAILKMEFSCLQIFSWKK